MEFRVCRGFGVRRFRGKKAEVEEAEAEEEETRLVGGVKTSSE